jgi:hypothetical protein
MLCRQMFKISRFAFRSEIFWSHAGHFFSPLRRSLQIGLSWLCPNVAEAIITRQHAKRQGGATRYFGH